MSIRPFILKLLCGFVLTARTAQAAAPTTSAPCPMCDVPLSPRLQLPVTAATQPATQPGIDHTNMIWIPAGIFWMGSNDARFADAAPVHQVKLDGFWIDRTDVTNDQFARFVTATGYLTAAERPLDPAANPDLPKEALAAGALVFSPPAVAADEKIPLDNPGVWWHFVPGASWKHPQGPASDIRGKGNFPVVDIAWTDAQAYANWAGKQLPTEAQWEYAARGGLDRKPYVWGEKFNPGGKWMANSFQGNFPQSNSAADGFAGTSPVGSFPANGYGLFDMAGNVWQWCADWYQPDYYSTLKQHGEIAVNPTGPANGNDPAEPNAPKHIMKGGSFLCTDQYCSRFMPGARGKGDAQTALENVGFRCMCAGK